MIRAADLSTCLVPLSARSLPASHPRAGEPVRAVTWWDEAGVPQGTAIVAGLDAEARGLGVEQHAERVLVHLLGGVDRV
ncbi:MAG: hypothetical protein ABI696_00220 [Rubrivivax sp.]